MDSDSGDGSEGVSRVASSGQVAVSHWWWKLGVVLQWWPLVVQTADSEPVAVETVQDARAQVRCLLSTDKSGSVPFPPTDVNRRLLQVKRHS